MVQEKNTPWEGAIRTPCAIWSPLLKHRQRVSEQLIHNIDWLPTFAQLAGVNLSTKIDGVSVWDALSLNKPSPRNEILGHYDTVNDESYTAYIRGKWKYVNGTSHNGAADDWTSVNSKTEIHKSMQTYGKTILESLAGQALLPFSYSKVNKNISFSDVEINKLRESAIVKCIKDDHQLGHQCRPLQSPCLFNIQDDTCEQYNLAPEEPKILEKMDKLLEKFRRSAVTPRNKLQDKRAHPKYYNNTWSWWYDELRLNDDGNSLSAKISRGLFVGLDVLVLLLMMIILSF